MKHLQNALSALLLLSFLHGASHAQNTYPSKPIKVIVPREYREVEAIFPLHV